MMKAALLALPNCCLEDMSPLLQQIAYREWRLRVLTLDGRPAATREGLRILSDDSIQNAVPLDLHLCIIPGGHYHSEIWEDLRLHRFLRQFDARRGWIATSCEGVLCVAAANLLGGVQYSAPEAMVSRYAHLLRTSVHCPSPITVDSNIISSDGSNPRLFSAEIFRHVVIGS
ncbi:DJ-1/PfpI family protein [Alicyclobacillus acidiphilus]|uniref:DJ-1/PfpI family protein n=1 Tax=Alicyclobacillus acidiphilus TaxID=182455 RepID=UPI00082DFDB8|nr:DJ-1/PfpI family protein [Alicyclobacillus acidiphilus]